MEKRNLTADLAICEAATAGPWFKTDGIHALYVSTDACMDVIAECEVTRDATFIAEARTGWPHAIQRAMAAEKEVERLRALIRDAVDEHKRISGRVDAPAKDAEIVKQTVSTETTETINGFTYITVHEHDIESTTVCSGCKEPLNFIKAYTQREVIDERTFKFYSVHKYCRALEVPANAEN
jgi:hypothetical protein